MLNLPPKLKTEDENALPAGTTEPKLEQVTMPPPPKADEDQPKAQPKPEVPTPKVEATSAARNTPTRS